MNGTLYWPVSLREHGYHHLSNRDRSQAFFLSTQDLHSAMAESACVRLTGNQ
jgi:hypothetical protein